MNFFRKLPGKAIVHMLPVLLLGMALGVTTENRPNAAVMLPESPQAAAPADSRQEDSVLERFDVKKGEVTARVPLTAEIREEAALLVQSLGGQAGVFRVDPTDGIVLRVPLKPSLEISKPGFYAFATEVFLFLPEGVPPYILVFSEENEPRIFSLTQSPARLLQLCGWEKDASKLLPSSK